MATVTGQQSLVGSPRSADDNPQSGADGQQSPGADQSPAPSLLSRPWYWYYVLGLLTLCYIANVVDRSQVLAAALQAIKREFNATDAQLGILSGVPFALFYSFLGIPIAAWADRSSRRNVLAWSCALWSAATGVCGMAVNFSMLFVARVGTAVGEAGGSPPSHSLISDYFPKLKRGTAFSIFALAVPIGTSIGAALGGWGTQHLGWRATFYLVGFPGIFLALLVRMTVIEPPRGYADHGARIAALNINKAAPGVFGVLLFMWKRASFRHLALGTALHSVVWYASGAFNNAFFQRSHQMTVVEAGYWISLISAIGGIGTFAGGYLSDKLSRQMNDRRWYLWVPGIATLLCVPLQFVAYLSADRALVMPMFGAMTFMAAVFFGPSFAMTQAIATLRMRSVATSLLLLVQTLIGQCGPWLAGFISDRLAPSMGRQSLRYALVIVGLVNIWAALHYVIGARTLRQDLEATETLATV